MKYIIIFSIPFLVFSKFYGFPATMELIKSKSARKEGLLWTLAILTWLCVFGLMWVFVSTL